MASEFTKCYKRVFYKYFCIPGEIRRDFARLKNKKKSFYKEITIKNMQNWKK